MNIKDIINALKNNEVESKGEDAFFFTALCDGRLAQAGRAASIEEEIHMLVLHMEAVRTLFVRHGKELGFDNDFSDPAEWMAFLTIMYMSTTANGMLQEAFNGDSTQTRCIRMPRIK